MTSGPRRDDQTKSLIQADRGYLAEIPLTPHMPQIVVCLNIVYPTASATKENWLKLRSRALARKLLKSKIARELDDIAGCQGAVENSVTCDCALPMSLSR